MKRTLVERVAEYLCDLNRGVPWEDCHRNELRDWERKARRIIAMVRRHDAGKGAKK